MRAADRDPAGGESPMTRWSQPRFRWSPYGASASGAGFCAWGSSVEYERSRRQHKCGVL